MSDRGFRMSIYLTGFVLGFVLMGFEMLSSRYLNPWFGSGIYTWAAIISVTLFALMVGYFLGGTLVDRNPTPSLLGVLVIAAAVAMAAIPGLKDPLIGTVIDAFGDGRAGVTIATVGLIFVPLVLIACFSPFAVRLLLAETAASGRQTGMVYGISTFGNILGVWFTTFYLIPAIGSNAITLVFAVITALAGVFLIAIARRRRA